MTEGNRQPFVFIAMPFSDAFTDIYDLGIKQACVSAGARCERVDEQIFLENILERIFNQIVTADIIVAEMTGRNPNVFYEVGYAHALKKQVILLTQNPDDIPFDLKHYPHIVYGGKISTLKTELEKRVRWCIENGTLQQGANTGTNATSSFLTRDFPPSLTDDLKAADEVWLVGASLDRTIEHDSMMIEEKLKNGCGINVLVVHPTDTLIEPAVRRSKKRTTLERKRMQLMNSLQMLCDLQQETAGKLQIRTIQYPLTYGAYVINPGQISGSLYIKLYPYKQAIFKPKLVFRASEGGWYDYYLSEIRTLWENGTEWQCK